MSQSGLAIKATQADNFYFPPDYEERHGTINKINKAHTLGKRAKYISDGIIIIRFEMPFHVRCDKCLQRTAQGVRFNARKKKVGNYYTTPIYEFTFLCKNCENPFVIRTDPEHAGYSLESGCTKCVMEWDAKKAGSIEAVDPEIRRDMDNDPMFKLERTITDEGRVKAQKNDLRAIMAREDELHGDSYAASRIVRKRFREESKVIEAERKRREKKNNFGMILADVNDEDTREAARLRRAGKFKTDAHSVNNAINKAKKLSEPIFGMRSVAQAAAAAVKLAQQQGRIEGNSSNLISTKVVPTADNPFGDPFQPKDVLDSSTSVSTAEPVMLPLGINAYYIMQTMMRLLDPKTSRFEARLEDEFDCKAFFDLGVAGTLVVMPVEGHNVTSSTVAAAVEFIKEDVIPRCLTQDGIKDLWEEYSFSSKSRGAAAAWQQQQEGDKAAIENEEWLKKVEAYQPKAHHGKGGIGCISSSADNPTMLSTLLGAGYNSSSSSSSGQQFVHGPTLDPEDAEAVVSNLVKIPEKVSQVITRRIDDIKVATKVVDIRVSSTPQGGQRSVMLKGTKNRIETVKQIFMEFRASAADKRSATLDTLLNELRGVYLTHKRSFDIRCHAEYIDRMARLSNDKVPKLEDDHWRWVERALEKFQQNGFLHAPTVREGLGRLCHSVARCIPDNITFHQVLAKTIVVAPISSMSPPALTATMWSLATLHVSLEDKSPYRVSLSLIAEQCANKITLVDKTAPIVKSMWAAIKVDVADPIMQDLYRKGLAHTIDLHTNKGVPLTLKDVILLLWGSATLSKLGPVMDVDKLIDISSRVICSIQEKEYEIDPQNTTMALWSLANFIPESINAHDLVCRVIAESIKNAEAGRLSPFELSLVLWSMGKMYDPASRPLRDVIVKAVLDLKPKVDNLLHVFSLRQLANVLWSFGATRIDGCRDIFDASSTLPILKSGRVTSNEYRQSIANIAWAYATHDYSSETVSNRVKELLKYFTSSRYDDMTSQHAATIAWALWRMRGMEANSINHMAMIAQRYGDRFANRHVITLTRAAAGAKFYHPALLDVIIRRPITSWTTEQCGQLLWVLATWSGVSDDKRMIEYAINCDEIVRQHAYTNNGGDEGDTLSIDKLTTVEWASALLDLPTPTQYLWDRKHDYIEAHASDLTVSQVLRERLADADTFGDMGLTQLYWAWVLRCGVDHPSPPAWVLKVRSWLSDATSYSIQPSTLQMSVNSHLPSGDWRQEYLLPPWGISIDIASPSNKIAIEVDGKVFHSVYDVTSSRTFLDASARVKKRLLDRQGWRLIRIGEQEYKTAEDGQAKRKLLASALSSNDNS
ncbi:hypothetical protein FOL47_005963 [Perkinsus chesapeaki]|uniref:Coiled-coil domain-containing protein 94 n=1 Tax=Perkinsus chesapeaki TaxID=330153 RepID=A0A7J6MYW3_PERCH|nr:hypothetical protein FOL47_005963 [Perkinsus chesapeaki]